MNQTAKPKFGVFQDAPAEIPASEKQIAMINDLLANRDLTGTAFEGHTEAPAGLTGGRNGSASAAITALLALPRTTPASAKQVAYIEDLRTKRAMTPEVAARLTAALAAGMTAAKASATIDWLNSQPRVAAVPAKATSPEARGITEGMYKVPATGGIYKVQRAIHGSGHLMTKRLVGSGTDWTFVRDTAAMAALRPEYRMTLEEAKEFGTIYGVCVNCGAVLTDQESIARGLGPICAGKEFWA